MPNAIYYFTYDTSFEAYTNALTFEFISPWDSLRRNSFWEIQLTIKSQYQQVGKKGASDFKGSALSTTVCHLS